VEKHPEELDAILERLLESLFEELPGFGRYLAIDSKHIESHGRPRGKEILEKLKNSFAERECLEKVVLPSKPFLNPFRRKNKEFAPAGRGKRRGPPDNLRSGTREKRYSANSSR